MKNRLLTLAIFAIGFVVTGVFCSKAADIRQQSFQTTLPNFLEQAGKNIDVFFTLEGISTQNIHDFLMVQPVTSPFLPTNKEAIFYAVTNSLTNMIVIADQSDTRVYHIVDKRLFESTNYAMGQVLDSVKFQGNAARYVDYLNRRAPNLLNQNTLTGAVLIPNENTPITIDSKNTSLRDALSNGVKLDGYNRIIWTAFASLKTGDIRIKFNGMVVRP